MGWLAGRGSGRPAGEVADEQLNSYFAEDFMFHGPDGDLTYAQLRSFFTAMRTAFEGFACERRALISRGEYVSARTCMSGRFTAPFEASPVGTITPNGQLMRLELINHFRYREDGRLAEEWVQYDNVGLLRQLGVDLTQGR